MGIERGEAAALLAARRLRVSDVVRLERAWKRRTARDPATATALEAALARARGSPRRSDPERSA